MKLFYSPTSPYARKVRIVIIEKGLQGSIEDVIVNPFEAEVAIPSPLGKIPLLVRDDGGNLFDSPVICAYLDSLGSGPKLTCGDGIEHWELHRFQALGDGILDAAFNLVMERRRPTVEQSEYWKNRWAGAINGSVVEMAHYVQSSSKKFDIAQITFACALGYIDFRLPDFEWRSLSPGLDEWYDAIVQRDSVKNSAPQ